MFPEKKIINVSRADLVLINGNVITVDEKNTIAEAVAIKCNRILRVGSNAEVKSLADEDTAVIDLGGKTVVPGLIDPHVHYCDDGVATIREVDVRTDKVSSIKELLEKTRETAEKTPKGKWIIGHGSPGQDLKFEEKRFPDRWELDGVTTEHPVTIHCGAHINIANSLALEIGGITKDTPDPEGGWIVKDPETGEPTGVLRETAKYLVWKHIPEPTVEEYKKGILIGAADVLKSGTTTLHDIVTRPEAIRAYFELRREGKLPLRFHLLVRVIESKTTIEPLLKLGVITGVGDEWLQIGGVKMSIDGGITGRNAAFSAGYADQPGHHGVIRIPQELLEDTIRKAHNAGLQCHVHAIGDIAHEMTFKAFDKVLKESPREDHRHRVEHLGQWCFDEYQRRRTKELGLIPFPNPSVLAGMGEFLVSCLGPEICKDLYPFKTMLEEGFRFSIGSDAPGYWPVNTLRDAWACVTHKTEHGNVVSPQERITPEQALRLITIDAAWVGFEEDVKGSIEPGKLADLVVLPEDPLKMPPDDVQNLRPEITILDGKIVYKTD
jgi:predicted amidohydrolase YtcJ